MVRQPLIRFRYAIKKAAEAGVTHVSETTNAIRANARKTSASQVKANGGNAKTVKAATRIQKPIQRAPLGDDEMHAIMLGGAV